MEKVIQVHGLSRQEFFDAFERFEENLMNSVVQWLQPHIRKIYQRLLKELVQP